ncbi:lytic murein transglycosylase [Rhodospirillum centenum]|uniref:Membrane-bound lytic murein transglycosylase B, putative n=1 Tax=Rhodospirillum centenum (strain ATCC 51521 / SW) TaxID=414684 RepID=B6IMK0_RHOCS|nr:lytic murein transglycosylase [Rhodospirillum centenum]ACI98579.1 membrane-bound lytic murein transglycosylase B, putative [Rhodospirillum centenum SW]
MLIWLRTTALAAALAVAPVMQAAPAQAATDFAAWLEALRQDAGAQGISEATLREALTGVQPIPRVLELDRRQPEGTITFARYIERVVTAQRVRRGRGLYRQHRAVLEEVGRKYGVQPRFIVALWGIETSFGSNQGGFKVIDALATLAYDGRRSAYFRKELINALRILDEDHIGADRMLGSWAGAMGQSQFMPSSFLRYAVDFDRDGKRDIWGTLPDVFASAANYLSTVGWNPDRTWGREVRIPKHFKESHAGLQTRKTLRDWQAMGVRQVDGGPLPVVALEASLVLPDGPKGRAFLVYDNYRTIMDWNRSTYFATAVGLLSDRIGGAD